MSLESEVKAFRAKYDEFVMAYTILVTEKKKNRAPMARKAASEMVAMLKDIRRLIQEYKERI